MQYSRQSSNDHTEAASELFPKGLMNSEFQLVTASIQKKELVSEYGPLSA